MEDGTVGVPRAGEGKGARMLIDGAWMCSAC
jgi:hypothetical protein